jgi:hypothetical protein
MSRVRQLILAVVVTSATVQPVWAQTRQQEPIGKFAADVRGVLSRFPSDAATATALGVTEANLPRRGLGLSAGAHVYPFRMGKITVGFGGEWVVSRGSDTAPPATAGGPDGPTVRTRFSAISPQASLNFGSRRGWSYVSAGIGRASFTTEREATPVGDATSNPRTIHYGGGARWFAQEHLAFTFDLRFYRIDAQEATATRPAFGGRRMLVLSAGISVK